MKKFGGSVAPFLRMPWYAWVLAVPLIQGQRLMQSARRRALVALGHLPPDDAPRLMPIITPKPGMRVVERDRRFDGLGDDVDHARWWLTPRELRELPVVVSTAEKSDRSWSVGVRLLDGKVLTGIDCDLLFYVEDRRQ